MLNRYGNPSSGHVLGLDAKLQLDQARAQLRKLLSAETGQLIFTSGATEGINTSVLSVLTDLRRRGIETGYLLYSATEHKAVPEALGHWVRVLGMGFEVKAIPVSPEGQVDLQFIRDHLPTTRMLCTMAVNNETGLLTDLRAIESLIRADRPDLPWLVDCVQVLGKLPIQFSDISIDYACFSAHKLYGPKGAGLLFVRQGAAFAALQAGGGQESGQRGGTENVAGAVALGWIAEQLNAGKVFSDREALVGFRDSLLSRLRAIFPNLEVNHPLHKSVPTTLNISVPGYRSAELVSMFDAAGIRVSAGSACSTGRPRSFVLDAMGRPGWASEGAVRVSFGPLLTPAWQVAVFAALERLAAAIEKVQSAPLVDGLYVPVPESSACFILADGEAVIVHDSPELQVWLRRDTRFAALPQRSVTMDETLCGLRVVDAACGLRILNESTGRALELCEGSIPNFAASAVGEVAPCHELHVADQWLDVRHPVECELTPLPTLSKNLPLALWWDYALRVESEVCHVVCRTQGRSKACCELLSQAGVAAAHYLQGGVAGLADV